MSAFTLYPAIDLRAGRVVRLKQGDPAQATSYSDDAAETARRWLGAGAGWLHVVNLDGAFGDPESENQAALNRILAVARDFGAEVELGGGLRRLESVDKALQLGVRRVVIGTMALEEPGNFARALARYGPDHVVAGLDMRAGEVRMRGWRESARVGAADFANQLALLGLRTVIVTDIARDGMGVGLNLRLSVELARSSGLEVIGSGGVHTLSDVQAALHAGLAGIVVGRALYEGTLNLEAALREVADAGAPNHPVP